MKIRSSGLLICLAVSVAVVGGWTVWSHVHPKHRPATYAPQVYDESAAERDYAAGRKRFLVWGLNTSRAPLPNALLERGVTYAAVAGCVPPIGVSNGIAAYNRRMRDLLQQDTSPDLSAVIIL